MFGVLRPEGFSERALFIIDKDGVIRYVDVHDIDEQPDNEELFRELARIEGIPAGMITPASSAVAEPEWQEPDEDVVMYCTQWCPACRRARAFFKQHEIEFVEVDITRNRQAAALLRSWANGSETTPTFKVKGMVYINFRMTELAEALGIEL
jgi:glutaredoxin